MTPLHILSCSTRQDLEVVQLMIGKYPEALVTKDRWGDTPLLYALWCNAPTDVMQALVDGYKLYHPEFEFDWADMIMTLREFYAPLGVIQTLVNVQMKFPDQQFDLQDIVTDLAVSDSSGPCGGPFTRYEVFLFLLRLSVSKRLDGLKLERWRKEIEDDIELIGSIIGREKDTSQLYAKLALLEIKEASSILELAVWNAKIKEVSNIRRCKRAKVGHNAGHREECRINCGADIIVRNVLPYLLPNKSVDDESSYDESSYDGSFSDE